jgi:glycosyltransferase involved in cell wall biosynthesis
MKIIFLTTAKITNVNASGIYTDLLREFKKNGHEIYIVCPVERKFNEKTSYVHESGINILKVWSPNIQKTNLLEKGISTLILGYLFKIAIDKYINITQIDLIIYSTPPVTFNNLISELKKKSKAKTYLLLKDIFPQNAVDLEFMKKSSLIYNYFRKQERELYKISDYIGCMSPANCKYLLHQNSELNPQKIEVNPNSIDTHNFKICNLSKEEIIQKYNLPTNKVFFIYGGNLGKPQGVEYIKKNIEHCKSIKEAFFLIIGSGTEFSILENWIAEFSPQNVVLYNELPQFEYEELLRIADVGLIFLNPKFTIPNFPSRLLYYMKYSLPILCSVDEATDVGDIVFQNNFGLSCNIESSHEFLYNVILLLDNNKRKALGQNSLNFLKTNYSVDISYNLISSKF